MKNQSKKHKTPAEKSLNLDKITLGVCYYPEHWSPELWKDDLERMSNVGIEIIRIGEFAWNLFEPKEGEFSFEFFDQFLKVLEQHSSLKVIFCTPTATPPAWLTHKYPEVLNKNSDGLIFNHGERRHYNYNSEIYIDKTHIIAEKLAAHYHDSPRIIGWQIDNELNCATDTFYSDADQKSFRKYLRNKYGSLDTLNKAWGTVFWNQTYTDWEEIFLTRYTGERRSSNPHATLEEKHFFSESAVAYCKLQYDILKKYVAPNVFITTNGTFNHLDYNNLVGSAVDFMTYDSYPNYGFDSKIGINSKGLNDGELISSPFHLNDRKWSWHLANTRAFSPIFGVMEQQTGPNGWVNRTISRTPRPGQIRLWTFQSIAHGADFISYFRWRTCTFGTEIYWHGILDYSNSDNRRLKEVETISKEINSISGIAGTKFFANIAILRDYDNIWDGEYDIWHGPLRSKSEIGWFNALQETHTPFDIVYVNEALRIEDLLKYKYLIYPHAAILTKNRASLLEQYVKQGGHIIFGARTGYKDINGQCPMMVMPGFVAQMCGITIKDFSPLSYPDTEQIAKWGEESLEMALFNDIISPESDQTKILATYKGNYYDGEAAFTEHVWGKGKAYYFGASFSTQAASCIINKLGIGNPYDTNFELPECCEIAVRTNEATRYFFILNYSAENVTITTKNLRYNLLTNETIQGDIEIPGYGVMVLS